MGIALMAGRLGEIAEVVGVPHAALALVVASILGYVPARVASKWYWQWRCFRRPSSSMPAPGERGTLEGTVVSAGETIPAPHAPSIEAVAWHLWDYNGVTTSTYSRIRPFILETSFGRVHVTVDDPWWHPSLSWDDGFDVDDHEEHRDHIRISLARAQQEQHPDGDFREDERPGSIPIGHPRMALVRPGDRITVSGVFQTNVQTESVRGYRGVSPSEACEVIVRAGPSPRRNVVITPGDYAAMQAFWSRLQFRIRYYSITLALMPIFLIGFTLFMLERP